MRNSSILYKILVGLIGLILLVYMIFVGFLIKDTFVDKKIKSHNISEEYVVKADDFESFIRGSIDRKIEYLETKTHIINKSLSYEIEVNVNQFCNKDDLIYTENGVQTKARNYGYIKEIKDVDGYITIVFEEIAKIKAFVYLEAEDEKMVKMDSTVNVSISKKTNNKEVITEYEAKISGIINEFNNKTNTIFKKVELIINNNIDNLFSTSDYVKVHFDYKKLTNVILIPSWYIFDIDENERSGYVNVIKSGKKEKTKIKFENHDSKGNYHIIEGLEVGNKIGLSQ